MFQPDYRYMLDVLANRRPARLPVYEHIISPIIMEQILGVPFAPWRPGTGATWTSSSRHYCRFFREMTYDTVSYEVCITEILPGHGAIMGGKGPIQNRADFDRYPVGRAAGAATGRSPSRSSTRWRRHLPPGMKALGGVGNGVFEISEDLVGLRVPGLPAGRRPRAVRRALPAHRRPDGEHLAASSCAATPTPSPSAASATTWASRPARWSRPRIIRQHVIPQYRRVIDAIHGGGQALPVALVRQDLRGHGRRDRAGHPRQALAMKTCIASYRAVDRAVRRPHRPAGRH